MRDRSINHEHDIFLVIIVGIFLTIFPYVSLRYFTEGHHFNGYIFCSSWFIFIALNFQKIFWLFPPLLAFLIYWYSRNFELMKYQKHSRSLTIVVFLMAVLSIFVSFSIFTTSIGNFAFAVIMDVVLAAYILFISNALIKNIRSVKIVNSAVFSLWICSYLIPTPI